MQLAGCFETGLTQARPQHDAARTLLTKYSHEKTYRLREALAGPPPPPELPELPEIAAVESTIPEPPASGQP